MTYTPSSDFTLGGGYTPSGDFEFTPLPGASETPPILLGAGSLGTGSLGAYVAPSQTISPVGIGSLSYDTLGVFPITTAYKPIIEDPGLTTPVGIGVLGEDILGLDEPKANLTSITAFNTTVVALSGGHTDLSSSIAVGVDALSGSEVSFTAPLSVGVDALSGSEVSFTAPLSVGVDAFQGGVAFLNGVATDLYAEQWSLTHGTVALSSPLLSAISSWSGGSYSEASSFPISISSFGGGVAEAGLSLPFSLSSWSGGSYSEASSFPISISSFGGGVSGLINSWGSSLLSTGREDSRVNIPPPSISVYARPGAYAVLGTPILEIYSLVDQTAYGASLKGVTKAIKAYGSGRGSLGKPSFAVAAEGTNVPVGRVNLGNFKVPSVSAQGYLGQNGSVDVSLLFNDIYPYLGEDDVSKIVSYAGGQADLAGFSTSLSSVAGGVASISLKKPSVSAHGYPINVLKASIGTFAHTLEALSGGQILVEIPITSSIRAQSGSGAELSGFSTTVEASGYLEAFGRVNLGKPSRNLNAYAGATVRLGSISHTFGASVSAGSTGSVDIKQPNLSVIASGFTPDYGRVSLGFPAIDSVWGLSSLDGMSMQISAFGSIELSLGVENIAYAMTISSAETTKYTNYAFDYIVRLAGKYYGFKPDGMYLLEGSSDEGEAIACRFKTSMLDFETALHKRVPYLYIDTEQDTTVTTYVEDQIAGTYTAGHNGRRVRLARGPRGRQWEFEVTNISGNDLKVGSLELFAQVLSRKV